ncbi:glycine cleavage system protein R [Catenovulum sediminis]|uniref:Glycine cleavage system transcriptional repressor n=1 Tax=Catenovulum sediminis TaxID=1740262 RepID=A0ABV1RL91_9ALTE|nr:ACT domain-containing protein [Catenovulum sediminis]
MQINLVISLITRDKPGVIEKLSAVVKKHQGNWLASNFCRLSGQFAGIVEISCPTDAKTQLSDEIAARLNHEAQIHIAEGQDEQNLQSRRAQLSVMGNDKSGIVNQISATLAEHNVNLVRLNSTCESAPNWGSLLFKADATLEIPETVDIDDIQEALEEIANDLIVEISLKSAE